MQYGQSQRQKQHKGNSKADRYAQHVEDAGDGAGFRQFPPAHTDEVMSVAPVSSGLALSGSKDKSVVLYDFTTGSVRENWQGHDREVTKVRYGRVIDGYFSSSRDKEVRMWKSGHQDPVLHFLGHELVVTGMSLNQDNSQLCTGSRDNSVRIWDVQTGNCVLQNSISRNLVTDVCWGKGSNLIAQTGEDKEFRIWDSQNLQVCTTFPRKQYIQNCCDMSEDNNYALTCSNGFGGSGCEATLWDLRAGKLVCEYKGHHETVGACAFIPSCVTNGNNLIATCSSDCTIRIWNRDTKDCVASMSLGGSGPLTSLAMYEDGSFCVSSFNIGINVLKLVTKADGDFDLLRLAQY